MQFITTWIELEDTMLIRVSYKKKEKYQLISLICSI